MFSFSKRYIEVVGITKNKILIRLNEIDIQPIELTQEQYSCGVRALPDNLQAMSQEVAQQILDEENYDLSYSQLCSAFFVAAEELNLVSLKFIIEVHQPFLH